MAAFALDGRAWPILGLLATLAVLALALLF
jgi:hypothetical protein